MRQQTEVDTSEPIHAFFELTYASYLVLPRSVLQSAPLSWQRRFVQCLHDLEAMFGSTNPPEGEYEVRIRDAAGKYRPDPLSHYHRGRRRVPRIDTEVAR